jgi:hypothetical protein
MATIQRYRLTRADLALYDGKSSTYARVDTTGGTVTGLRINDDVDVLQVYGAGTNRTRGTIADAINAIGSAVVTLSFAPGAWAIDDTLTIPSTMAVRVKGGCVFSVSSGKTLTFAGPVHVEYATSTGAGWYSGAGSVSCSQGATGFPGW